jgi:hypothetical protein
MELQTTDKRRGTLPLHTCQWTFERVQKMYAEIRQSEPIGASSVYFQLGESRGQRLTAASINFCIDAERATAKALENNRALMDVWQKLLIGESVELDAASTVIRLCGELYVQRGLEPTQYFRHIKKRAA